MNYEGCTVSTKDSRVVVQENRSRFEVLNSNRESVKKIQVDGCLLDETKEKCDWLIAIDSINKAFFIELKGCDLDKAISQLQSTLVHTKNEYGEYERQCFAVTTRVPKHGSSVRKKSIDFFKRNKVTLSVKNLNSQVVV